MAKMEATAVPVAMIHSLMPRVMESIGNVPKTGFVRFGGKETKTLRVDDVREALNKACAMHGVSMSVNCGLPTVSERAITKPGYQGGPGRDVTLKMVHFMITIRFVASDGSFIECSGPGYGEDEGDKAFGKAYSYGVKNILLNTFSIPTGDPSEDTDLHGDNHASYQPSKPAPKATKPAPADPSPKLKEENDETLMTYTLDELRELCAKAKSLGQMEYADRISAVGKAMKESEARTKADPNLKF